jgi:hypothetical protein
MYLKITNEAEIHKNLSFQPEGSCVAGGIYFTTPEHICGFLDYGPWIREITIPNGHLEVVKYLVEHGADIHACGS